MSFICVYLWFPISVFFAGAIRTTLLRATLANYFVTVKRSSDSMTDSSSDLQRWSILCDHLLVKKLFVSPRAATTNNDAKEKLASGELNDHTPFAYVALSQTLGRGRGDHTWWSPEGGLYLTLVGRWSDFSRAGESSVELSIRTARAIAETLSEALAKGSDREGDVPSAHAPAPVEIHPPNDVYVAGRKIAGILIESPRPEFVVIGMGVNVNSRAVDAPPELQDKIVTLRDLTARETDLPLFAVALVRRLLFGPAKL